MKPHATTTRAALALFVALAARNVAAASCSTTLSASYPAPSVADGYVAQLVANGLSSPRGIKFDSHGALLVVEAEKGITALTLNNLDPGCIRETSRKTVIADSTLNHGIEMSFDGATLYASSPEAAYSWRYDASKQRNTSAPKTLVYNMTNEDHTTRTLLLSKSPPGLLLVTRGSTSNIDALAKVLPSGHSQVKAFNLTNMTHPYDFEKSGLLLGWGLRNDVGIAEHPETGGIYTVENSVDQMMRNHIDIHETNPAEELNFLGYLNGTKSSNQGRNFGYPECYTAWDTLTIPSFAGKVGQQFAIGLLGTHNTDEMCSNANRQQARLGFHPHMAPLDILFDVAGDTAWITFHGSWDSTNPVGYKLGQVAFAHGEPIEPSTSTTALQPILSNADNSACTKEGACFRPVGLAWDGKGTLFMSSDATGEIYAITRADGNATDASSTKGRGGGRRPKYTGSGTSGNAASSGAALSWAAAGLGVLAFAGFLI